MSALARENGWRGFDGIGEKVERVPPAGSRVSGWLYRCDGMPTMRGCHMELIVTRRLSRVGKKAASGWLVTYGLDFDGTPDKDVVLTFCPSCAAVVESQTGGGA